MKNLKQIREQYNLVTEKDEKEEQKLTSLVRAGLYDAKKLPALKRALDKGADKMTAQEKRMLLTLLDSLMNQVLSDQQVYKKVKQNVMKEAADGGKNYMAKPDPRWDKDYPTIPSIILLKKKAIRAYPDGQKVVLYYAQNIDKYVTIPFGGRGVDSVPGINEEYELDESVAGEILKFGAKKAGAIYKASKNGIKAIRGKIGKMLKSRKAAAVAGATAGATATDAVKSSSGSSGNNESPFKSLTPSASKYKPEVSSPTFNRDNPAVRSRDERNSRQANQKMAMATNESVDLSGNIFELNSRVSHKVVNLYESLNLTNKRKMITAMKESEEGLNKIIAFATGQK